MSKITTVILAFSLLLLQACATAPAITGKATIEKMGVSPDLNQRSKVDVGSTIAEQYEHSVYIDAIHTAGAEEGFALGKIKVPAGAFLKGLSDSSGSIQFCSQDRMYYDPLTGPYGIVCFGDDGNNGMFDKVRVPNISLGSWKVLDVEQPYERVYQEDPVDRGTGYKMELIYQGLDDGDIKVAYREYVNNMARPAFSQIVEYEYSSQEVEIAFKGARITVHSASNNSIEYTVTKRFDR
jgi:hypothetical protein